MRDFLPIVVIFFVVLVFARGNEIIPFFQSIPDKIEKIFQTNEPITEKQDINLVTLHCLMTCPSGYKLGSFGPRCKIPPNNPITIEIDKISKKVSYVSTSYENPKTETYSNKEVGFSVNGDFYKIQDNSSISMGAHNKKDSTYTIQAIGTCKKSQKESLLS